MLLVPIRILCPEITFKKPQWQLELYVGITEKAWLWVEIGRKVLSKDKIMEQRPEKDRQIWGQ